MLESIIDIFSGGITIFGAGKSLHGHITGHTTGRRIDEILGKVELLNQRAAYISSKIERIDESVLFLHDHELFQSSPSGLLTPKKQIVRPSNAEIEAFKKVHIETSRGFQSALSSVEELPRGFLQEFNSDPLNFLVYKQKIGAGPPPREYLLDDTLVPIQFLYGTDAMIGFIKKGYVQVAFGLTYQEVKKTYVEANVFRNPFEGTDISRNTPCICGSGKKYKHCHGAFS